MKSLLSHFQVYACHLMRSFGLFLRVTNNISVMCLSLTLDVLKMSEEKISEM